MAREEHWHWWHQTPDSLIVKLLPLRIALTTGVSQIMPDFFALYVKLSTFGLKMTKCRTVRFGLFRSFDRISFFETAGYSLKSVELLFLCENALAKSQLNCENAQNIQKYVEKLTRRIFRHLGLWWLIAWSSLWNNLQIWTFSTCFNDFGSFA